MGIFATLTRRTTTDGPEAGRELSERERLEMPPRFEAVGEALASGSGSSEACAVVGKELAQDGASLDEALAGLRATSLAVAGVDPGFNETQALSVAWSESTLAYLHQLSCEDPMTGLASLAHVRSRLSELYRGELRESTGVQERYALVVADLPHDGTGLDGSTDLTFTRALRMARLGRSARTVFAGHETIGRLGENRIAVIVRRDQHLGRRVAVLRTLVGSFDPAGRPARAWIEGLPGTDESCALLVDELARN